MRGAEVLKANIWVWATRSHLLRALAGMGRRTRGTAATALQASWKRGGREGRRLFPPAAACQAATLDFTLAKA